MLGSAAGPRSPAKPGLLARTTLPCLLCRVDRACLEDVDLSWGGGAVTDASAVQLSTCPRLRRVNLRGTAITDAGLRQLVAAGGPTLEVEAASCRGLGRAVRQAAAAGADELRRELGLRR